MKMVAKIFCILIFTVLCESKKSLVPQAISQLVQSNYGERPEVIEIFYTSKKMKILDETLKLLKIEKQLKIAPIDMNNLSQFSEENCTTDYLYYCVKPFSNDAIFLFDTMENYQEWKLNLHDPERYVTKHNHLVYCEDASETKILNINASDKDDERDTYESFLFVNNDRISLHAITMFTEKNCSADQLVEINQFSSLKRKWKTEKFFMPRIENFHGCELRIAVEPFYQGLPFVKVPEKEDGIETAEGLLIDMFEALSTHLNFTATYVSWKSDAHNDNITYDFIIGADLERILLM